MANRILARIVMPSSVIFEAEVDMINLCGQEGQFGVLLGHCKLVSNLNTGIISVIVNNQEKRFFVYKGVAQVSQEYLNIASEFVVELDKETRTNVMNQVALLKSSLDEQDSGESLSRQIQEDKIEKYESLLAFI
jgi:F-type H+-transporting ATPase subunit epsilon